jgi:hypothetical protein
MRCALQREPKIRRQAGAPSTIRDTKNSQKNPGKTGVRIQIPKNKNPKQKIPDPDRRR